MGRHSLEDLKSFICPKSVCRSPILTEEILLDLEVLLIDFASLIVRLLMLFTYHSTINIAQYPHA